MMLKYKYRIISSEMKLKMSYRGNTSLFKCLSIVSVRASYFLCMCIMLIWQAYQLNTPITTTSRSEFRMPVWRAKIGRISIELPIMPLRRATTVMTFDDIVKKSFEKRSIESKQHSMGFLVGLAWIVGQDTVVLS